MKIINNMPIIESQPIDLEMVKKTSYQATRDVFRRMGIKVAYRQMQSDNYVAGTSGWIIRASGTAEFTTLVSGSFVTSFIQGTVPTSLHVGDLWIHTGDNNKVYRSASVGADEIKAGEWIDAGTLANWSEIVDDDGHMDDAQEAADAAQGDATSALSDLSDIADDAEITPVEKLIAKQLWDAIVVEGTATTGTIPAAAIALGVSTTDFDTDYAALDLYLNTTIDVFSNMAVSTTITRADWDTAWKDYYDERTKILNATAAAAAAAGAEFGVNISGGGSGDGQVSNTGYVAALGVSRLLAGSIKSKIITLEATDADVMLRAGKLDFGSTANGFIIGIDFSDSQKPKLEIGGSTRFLNIHGGDVEMNASFIVKKTAGEALLAGQAVMLADDGKVYMAFGNSTLYCQTYMGIILENVAKDGTAKIVTHGNEALWGGQLTKGGIYYIGDATKTNIWALTNLTYTEGDDNFANISADGDRIAQSFREGGSGDVLIREISINLMRHSDTTGGVRLELWTVGATGYEPASLISGATSESVNVSTIGTSVHGAVSFYFEKPVVLSKGSGFGYAWVLRPDSLVPFDANNGVFVEVGYAAYGEVGYEYGAVYKSTDSGSNWTQLCHLDDCDNYDTDSVHWSVKQYTKNSDFYADTNLRTDTETVEVKVGKAYSQNDMYLQRSL